MRHPLVCLISALIGLSLHVAPASSAEKKSPTSSAPSTSEQSTDNPPDAWRYVHFDGHLWYWQPNHMWRRWDGKQWSGEIPSAPRPPIAGMPQGSTYRPREYIGVQPGGFNPYPAPGYWVGPQRPGTGWVGGFYSSGGGRTGN